MLYLLEASLTSGLSLSMVDAKLDTISLTLFLFLVSASRFFYSMTESTSGASILLVETVVFVKAWSSYLFKISEI